MDALTLACHDWVQDLTNATTNAIVSSWDAEHYQQAQVLLETCYMNSLVFIKQLYIPDSNLYWTAGRMALHDLHQAVTSVSFWLFLTLRPVILFCYWTMYYFSYHVLYKFILVQGLYHHGLSQGKELCWTFWRFQCNMSRQQLLLQAGGVVLLYGAYQLQQFLKRRRYLYKLNLYLDRKKRCVIKSYHSFVQRIASISLLLAVMTPHALFLATAVGVKCLVPRFCTSLVQSRGVRDILSWWYPLICTLLLLLDHDHDNDNGADNGQQQDPEKKQGGTATATATSVDKENSAPKASFSSSRTPEPGKRPLTKKNGSSSTFSPFPRTTPPTSKRTMPGSLSSPSPARRWNRTSSSAKSATPLSYSNQQQRLRSLRRQSLATPLRIISQQQHFYSPSTPTRSNHTSQQQQASHHHQQQQQHHAQSLQDEQEADWLRFWIVRGTVQAMKVWLAWLTPVWLHTTLFHVEVLFYLWIYLMPYVQPESIRNGKQYYELPEGRPLQVLHDTYLQPAVEFLHDAISGAVPQDAWDMYIVQNVRRILSALVLVWMIQQSTADAILHVVQESRSLVVPAVTLFMPYFVTAYGVVYVQYGLSIAKSAAAIVQQREDDKSTSSSSSCQRWLSYWVLHCAFVAVLHRLQGLLWWIPFSTHGIFILWCALSIPRNIDFVYQFVCDELRAFSILPPKTVSKNNSKSSSTVDSNSVDDDGTTADANAAVVMTAWQETTTAKCLQWIWERLPKANNSNIDDDTATADDHHQLGSFNSNDDDNDDPNNFNDHDNAVMEESEQDDEDDDVTDKNELNDDDYLPPSSSPTSMKHDVLATDAAKASASVRRSARVVRKTRS